VTVPRALVPLIVLGAAALGIAGGIWLYGVFAGG
jgi:hypothetical protein